MSGNPFLDLLILAIPLLLVRLWWTGSRARELAIAHARRACQQRQLQFLDQTAAISSMKLSRDSSGSPCFDREYRFEFTDQGQFRDTATVRLLGHTLTNIHFPFTRDSEGNRIYAH